MRPEGASLHQLQTHDNHHCQAYEGLPPSTHSSPNSAQPRSHTNLPCFLLHLHSPGVNEQQTPQNHNTTTTYPLILTNHSDPSTLPYSLIVPLPRKGSLPLIGSPTLSKVLRGYPTSWLTLVDGTSPPLCRSRTRRRGIFLGGSSWEEQQVGSEGGYFEEWRRRKCEGEPGTGQTGRWGGAPSACYATIRATRTTVTDAI